ncbi:hypothetical protein C8Q79DRAFT_1007635 [Trametes meyenii]|nr:hypothetical protein C8Q79DRAFT_1007635 [Trametes meyenii]
MTMIVIVVVFLLLIFVLVVLSVFAMVRCRYCRHSVPPPDQALSISTVDGSDIEAQRGQKFSFLEKTSRSMNFSALCVWAFFGSTPPEMFFLFLSQRRLQPVVQSSLGG